MFNPLGHWLTDSLAHQFADKYSNIKIVNFQFECLKCLEIGDYFQMRNGIHLNDAGAWTSIVLTADWHVLDTMTINSMVPSDAYIRVIELVQRWFS